jgi:HD superfamily phosphohydrolase
MPAICDPIHDWIYCSPIEHKVIDTPLFQRLNWVSQLTLAKLFYPGGTHTRLSHSLGTMKICGDYMKNIFGNMKSSKIPISFALIPSKEFSRHLTNLARMAGLLHDIGHGPFSHAFDHSVYRQMYGIDDGGHDIYRLKLIEDPSIKNILAEGSIKTDELIAIWDPDSDAYKKAEPHMQDWYNIIRAVQGGPLGADRIDFTMRDSYFTGTQHAGTIARDRILFHAGVVSSPVDGRLHLCYMEEITDDVIRALDGRHWMYNNVYLNRTSSATHILVEKMMLLAEKSLRLIERTMKVDEFVFLNENTIMGEIMAYTPKGDDLVEDANMKLAKEYCKAIFQRILPRLVIEKRYDSTALYESENPFAIYKDDPQYEIIKTRYLAGVDATKFDQYGILFIHPTPEGVLVLDCEKTLKNIGYIKNQLPYFLTRVYKMPDLTPK